MARAVQTAIDSLNFFVESRNAGQILSVVTTATGGATSSDLVNTDQKGAMFFITFVSVTVSAATLALNINAKDVQAGTYFPYARVSVDGVSIAASTQYSAIMYVGVTSTPGSNGTNIGAAAAGNAAYIGLPVPGTFQVVASLTITDTTATTNSHTLSYSVDYAKVM